MQSLPLMLFLRPPVLLRDEQHYWLLSVLVYESDT